MYSYRNASKFFYGENCNNILKEKHDTKLLVRLHDMFTPGCFKFATDNLN